MLAAMRDRSLLSVEVSTHVNVFESFRETLASRMSEIQKSWPTRPIDLFGGEMRDDDLLTTHLYAVYSEREEGKGRINLSIECSRVQPALRISSRRRVRLAKQVQLSADVLSEVEPYAMRCHVHCTVTWRHAPGTVIPIVQLPLLKVDSSEIPFEQISGVRFTAPSRELYENVILDLEDDDHLVVSAFFTYFDSLSPTTIDRVVQKGKELKDAFVKQRNEGA